MQKIKNILSWMKKHWVVTGILTVLLVLCLLIGGITTANAGSLMKLLKANAYWILPVLIYVLVLVAAWVKMLNKDERKEMLKKSREHAVSSIFLAVIAGIGLVLTAVIIGKWCQYLVFLPSLKEAIKTNPPWTLIGGIVVAPAILLTWYWRHVHKEEDLKNKEQELANDFQKFIHDRERLNNERYTKAVELLASGKGEGHLGGIYALEQLAKDSDSFHWIVMETLCGFVRGHASWNKNKEDDQKTKTDKLISGAISLKEYRDLFKPTESVQAALTVIGRRPAKWREQETGKLDLHGTDLRGAYLKEAHLENALLQDAHLEGARLYLANFQGAKLIGAHLEGAGLDGTHFEQAYLHKAHLNGAILHGTHFDAMSNLVETHIEGLNMFAAQGLEMFHMDVALGDNKTIPPNGLKPSTEWIKKDKPGNDEAVKED